MISNLIIQSVIVILDFVTLLTINKFSRLVPARYLNSMKKVAQTTGLHPNLSRSQIIKNAVINGIDYS